MSILVDTTVEGPTANSYATVDETTAYAATTVWASAWAAVTAGDPQAALVIRAARALDAMLFPGYPTTTTQSMQWPRSVIGRPDGTLWDIDTVPQLIKNAQMHIAAWLSSITDGSDPFDVDPTAKIKRETVGPLTTEYIASQGPDGRRFLDTVIGPMLRPWGLLAPQGAVRLVR